MLLPIILLSFSLCCIGQEVWLEPDDVIVLKQGSSMTLTCNTSLTDYVMTITFTVEGREVQNTTNDTFTIEYLDEKSLSLGGEYFCTIDNGSAIIDSINSVCVYFAPVITQTPVNVYVTNNSHAQLSCSAIGYPPPTLKWIRLAKNNANLSPNLDVTKYSSSNLPNTSHTSNIATGSSTTSNFSIDPIQFEDYGEYICVATFANVVNITDHLSSFCAVSNTITVTVSPEDSVVVNTSNVTVRSNDSISLSCTSKGGPNNVFSWVKSEDIATLNTDIQAEDYTTPIDTIGFFQFLSDYILVNHSILLLEYVNGSSDGGNYTCLVTNEAGVGREETILYVSPVIIEQPIDTNAENGTRIVLSCNADSFPEPQYQWEMLNDTGFFNTVYSETEPTLVFDPVEFSNAGTYQCVVTTPTINEEVTSNAAVLTVSPNNSVVVTPTAITVDNGSNVTFICSAQGSEDNYFTWLRTDDLYFPVAVFEAPIDISAVFEELNGLIIANGSNLTIDSVNATHDGGSYSCLVFNVAGYDYEIGELFVNPVVTIPPRSIETEAGERVSLTCFADSFNPPQYQWELMNRTTGKFEKIEGETNTELLFESIDYEEYGMYQCVVTAEVIDDNGENLILANVKSEPALITVSPNGSISVNPMQTTVLRNTTVTFECNADGGPNNAFYWAKDDSLSVNTSDLPTSLNNVTTGNMLTLESVNGSSGGNYTCVVFNAAGFDVATVTLYVSLEIIQDPINVYTKDDETVMLTCLADSFPAPQYQWEFMKGTLFKTIYEETNSVIVFNPVDFSDAGRYHCVVTTPIIDETTTSNSALITVSPSGSISTTPTYQTGSRGADSKFDCSALGGPMNMFRWIMGNEITGDLDTSELPINVSETLDSLSYVVSTSNELVISVGTGQSSAQMQGGGYTCFVINKAGFENSSVTFYVSPEIVQDPINQFVENGDIVTLTCIGDSFPAPEYQWERWNMTTGSYEELPGETNNTLEFASIEYADYGRYRCVVTTLVINENATSNSALITVSPNSSVMIDPSPSVTIYSSDSVTFTCTAEGGPNNTFTWVRTDNLMAIDTNLKADDNTSPIDLDGLFELLLDAILVNDSILSLDSVVGLFDGGSYTCLVINEAGVGREETILYVSPAIIEQPMDTNAENGTRVVLTCIADSFPEPQYQWEMLNDTGFFDAVYSETEPTLVFDPVEYFDAGTYRCVVTTPTINEEVISNTAILTVSPNNSVVVTPTAITVDNGSSVTFMCSAQGSDDNYFTWLRTDDLNFPDDVFEAPIDISAVFEELNGLIITNGSNLTIDSVNATRDGGSYSCLTFNVAGYDSEIGELFVNPVLTMPSRCIETEAGERVSLTCFADSFNPPQYQWAFMNRTTGEFEEIEGETNTELLFESIDYEEYGMYQCVVTAEVIDDNGENLISVNVKSEPALITVSPNGSISVNPMQTTVLRNTNVTFECNADGGPNNAFYWVMDNSLSVDTSDLPTSLNNIVTIGNMLTLESVKGSSGGNYTCVVFNAAGFDAATVTLYVSLEIIQDPMNVYTKDDETVMLTCLADSFPAPQYQWEPMNGTYFKTYYGETISVIVFDPVDFSDLGRYHCVVTTPIIDETATSNSALITVSPFGSISTTPTYQTGSRGANSTFDCLALGGPMNMFRWIMGNEITGDLDTSELPINVSTILDSLSYVVSTSNELVISVGTGQSSAQMQGGHYTCFVINEAGFENSTVTLYVSPEIVQDPVDQFVKNGDSVTLTCIGDSFPAPEYQWERWNMATESYEELPGETSNTLEFASIEYADYGRYRCVVTAPIINENATSSSAIITVSPKGSVIIDPQITNSFNGTTVTLTCNAQGGPNNTFTWTYLRTGDVVATEMTAKTSQYSFISGILSGGEYQCTVSNDAGNDTDNAIVNVGPVITEEPKSQNVTIFTHNITLTCEAIGIPVPCITWTHNDTTLNEDGKLGEFENGITIEAVEMLGTVVSVLTIDSALANHTGQYYCNATSTVDFYESVMSDTVLILIQNVPDAPVNLTGKEINSRNVTLMWVEPHDNNDPILRYKVNYNAPIFFGAEELSVETLDDREFLDVINLHPGETYSFTVTAINKEGHSERSKPLIVRTLEEEPSGFPQNLNATTINSTAIVVMWDEVLLNETNGLITQYNITGKPDMSFADTIIKTVYYGSFAIVEFSNLEEFVIYRFTISASTKIGFGPVSPQVSTRTSQTVPDVSPGIPSDPVPNDSLKSTSVLLIWDLIPSDKANGDLTYSVKLDVIGQGKFREKRAAAENSNSLSQCLEAGGTEAMLSYSVPGNRTNLTVNSIAPYLNYSFTVAGVTDVGFGPSSSPVYFVTPEGVPTEPRSVRLVDTSSTSLKLTWLPPICDNGNRTGYKIVYGALTGSSSIDGFGDQPEILSPDAISYELSGLIPNSSYQVMICALTMIGCGVNVTVNTTTMTEDDTDYNETMTLYYIIGSLIFFFIIIGILVLAAIVWIYKHKKNSRSYTIKSTRCVDSIVLDVEPISERVGNELAAVHASSIEDDDEYATFFDPKKIHDPISTKDFPVHVQKMHSNDGYRFSLEYPRLEPNHNPQARATYHQKNKAKNRYTNITAYDHSRVKLQEIHNIPCSDYINANFINGYKSHHCYIASQGPFSYILSDFWRMVWEQHTATIVMLTKLEEKGRVKCHMYWPPADNPIKVFGSIVVHMKQELQLSDHTVRTFSLKTNEVDERIVRQFHFTAWPDFGVPKSPTQMLRFIRKIESSNPENAGPMIVHCSAGVGRTGTFIAIASQIKRIKDVETVDIFHFVQSMRYQRCCMVQTEEQYIFIHDALLEVIECGDTEVPAQKLSDHYHKLRAFTYMSGLKMQSEYNQIEATIHSRKPSHIGKLQCNELKNRFPDIVPLDLNRCKLSIALGVDGSDYINATLIEGYHKGADFIATQAPLLNTAEDFWRMVWEYKPSTIVMLVKTIEDFKETCHQYWPAVTAEFGIYGPFKIYVNSVEDCVGYVLRELEITMIQDHTNSYCVKQFQYVGWPSRGVPSSPEVLLEIRDQVEKWQVESGQHPVVVHCSDGSCRTGAFIAIYLLIERLKAENVVDTFQTVRNLRIQRPGMVCSLEQYDFIYKAVLNYYESHLS